MVEIPQDIIDNVIMAVGDDSHLLKQCSLVNSSFLLPSRKKLFSRITLENDETCQNIYEFLVQNPSIQSYIRAITLTAKIVPNKKYRYTWLIRCLSLPAILELEFRCLELFSINVVPNYYYLKPWCWDDFSKGLKAALSKVIGLPSLKILDLEGITKVPNSVFLHINHLTTLNLHFVSPNDFLYTDSSSLTPTSKVVVTQCVWRLYLRPICTYGEFPFICLFLTNSRPEKVPPPWPSQYSCRLCVVYASFKSTSTSVIRKTPCMTLMSWLS